MPYDLSGYNYNATEPPKEDPVAQQWYANYTRQTSKDTNSKLKATQFLLDQRKQQDQLRARYNQQILAQQRAYAEQQEAARLAQLQAKQAAGKKYAEDYAKYLEQYNQNLANQRQQAQDLITPYNSQASDINAQAASNLNYYMMNYVPASQTGSQYPEYNQWYQEQIKRESGGPPSLASETEFARMGDVPGLLNELDKRNWFYRNDITNLPNYQWEREQYADASPYGEIGVTDDFLWPDGGGYGGYGGWNYPSYNYPEQALSWYENMLQWTIG